MDIFYRIRAFHLDVCREYSPWDHFLKFIKRSCNLPTRLLLMSLQALHKKILGELFHTKDALGGKSAGHSYGHCDNKIVEVVWSLVRMCSSDDAHSVRALAADFVSKVSLYYLIYGLSLLEFDHHGLHGCRFTVRLCLDRRLLGLIDGSRLLMFRLNVQRIVMN